MNNSNEQSLSSNYKRKRENFEKGSNSYEQINNFNRSQEIKTSDDQFIESETNFEENQNYNNTSNENTLIVNHNYNQFNVWDHISNLLAENYRKEQEQIENINKEMSKLCGYGNEYSEKRIKDDQSMLYEKYIKNIEKIKIMLEDLKNGMIVPATPQQQEDN